MLDADQTGHLRCSSPQLGFDLVVFGGAGPPFWLHVTARPSRHEQSPEGRLFTLGGAGPPDDGLVPRPRKRHVEVPEVFAAFFFLAGPKVAHVDAVVLVTADVQFAAVRVCPVMEHYRATYAVKCGGIPQVGAVDDRELQALGPMDGQDLNGVSARVEAPAALLGLSPLGGRFVYSTCQPGPESRQA